MKSKQLFFFNAIIIALLLSVTTFNARAQSFIFHSEFVNAWSGPGYNFVNDINGYPSVTVQATSTDDEFIIEADNYYNKWDNYGTCTVNVVTPVVFYGNTPAFDPGNSFLTDSAAIGKFYTARIKNVGYTSTNIIIMETDSAPVTFGSIAPVTQTPAVNAVASNTPVDVMVTLDQIKSLQERVYIRYTNDNWATSMAAEVVFANASDIVGHAIIPAQAGGVTVNYYAFTTTVDVTIGVGDYDLITLKQETNAGANYQYTVMMPAVGTAQITFQVNMSNENVTNGVFLAGSFNGFSATANPMSLVGNGIYTATITVDTNIVLQYKFVNGSTYEVGNSACGIDDGLGGYNRNYVVPETDATIPVVCFNECSDCVLPTYADVTFSVNMSNETVSPLGVFLAGSFNGFSATADSMIAVGNGVYEITLSLDTTLSVQYKFVNGNAYEAGNAACGVNDGLGGYNRVYEVMGTNSIISTVCFNECTNCYVPAFADVTFSVNMSTQTVSPLGVFLAGSFNGFSAAADSMILVGNGVYELTLNLDTTLSVQYKFVNGNSFEAGNAACGVNDGLGGYNRFYEVMGTNSIISTVCFNECTNCYVPAFADVTFSVNMSNQTVSPLGVFLAGSFNGFSATADSMIAVGNGVYEITLSLDTTLSVQYKFVNGNAYEAGNAACGVPDGINGFNRVYNVMGTNSIIPTVCFNECANCVPVGLLNTYKSDFNIYPNPVQAILYLNVDSKQQQNNFQIINQLGAIVLEGTITKNIGIDVSNLKSGSYFISVTNNDGFMVKHFIKD